MEQLVSAHTRVSFTTGSLVAERLSQFAAERGLSRSSLIQQLVVEALDARICTGPPGDQEMTERAERYREGLCLAPHPVGWLACALLEGHDGPHASLNGNSTVEWE
jgi:hypothetical protein